MSILYHLNSIKRNQTQMPKYFLPYRPPVFESIQICMQNYFGDPTPELTAQKWLCLWNQNDTTDPWIFIGDSGGPAIVCPVSKQY